MSTELNIVGMTCGHCQAAVAKALQAVPGVQNVQVDLQAGRATVESAGEAQPDVAALLAAVAEEGYTAQVRP